jgi:hypothetical protein
LTLTTTELLSHAEPDTEGDISLCIAGYEASFRPPTSRDAIAAADQRDPALSRRAILQGCLLSITHEGTPVTTDHLPPDIIEAIAEQMGKADTLADIRMGISCPHCIYQWQSVFDIVSFLWSEIEAWAVRILSEVHTLASAYGWCERDILTLNPARREFYLDMIGT